MVKTMVSCRFSLKPIQWWMAYDASVLNCYRFAGSLGRGISPSELIRSSCFFIRPSHWSKRRALGVRSKTNKKQTRLTEAIVLGGSGKTYGIKISVDFSTDFAWSAEYPMCHVGQMVLNTRLWQKPTHFLRMSSSSVKVGSYKKKRHFHHMQSYAIICNHMQSVKKNPVSNSKNSRWNSRLLPFPVHRKRWSMFGWTPHGEKIRPVVIQLHGWIMVKSP